jgi:hypothetical protein
LSRATSDLSLALELTVEPDSLSLKAMDTKKLRKRAAHKLGCSAFIFAQFATVALAHQVRPFLKSTLLRVSASSPPKLVLVG